MHTPIRPKGLRERPTARARVKGLQGLMSRGSEDRSQRQEMLNRLNQLRWEKERLDQERLNAQQKLQAVDKRLAEIREVQTTLEQAFFAGAPERTAHRKSATAVRGSAGDLVLRY